MSSDYTTVGHVTADVMADGSRRPGGGAFYSALQAARLGKRVRILTQGVRAEIEGLLAPWASELELDVIDAPHTTTLASTGARRDRSQRMLAWAGEIGADVSIDTTILHMTPVARETPSRWRGGAGFVGLTPQGLVRGWSGIGARIVPRVLDQALLPERCDAIVFSSSERESCAALLAPAASASASAWRRGAIVAVTAAARPAELYLPGGDTACAPVPPVSPVHDDVGAGDVFAAAFFVALAEGSDARAAAAFANAAAAVRIAGDGADAIGDRAAIAARMDSTS